MKSISLRCSLLLVGLCSFLPVFAQHQDDTLQETKIIRNRKHAGDLKWNDFAPGAKFKSIDSTVLQHYNLQNIADVLTQEEAVFVKSYGFNQLATVSFRGASAAQSLVLWHGVPIQNAALGVADITAVPVLLTDKINLVFGSSGALLGSGNVGGAMLLENNAPVFDSAIRFSAYASGGSFSQFAGGTQVQASGKRWYTRAVFYLQSSQNNFPYTNATGTLSFLNNSAVSGGAGLIDFSYKINSHQTISFSVWKQQLYREIPAALFESSSDKKTLSGSERIYGEWRNDWKTNELYVKTSVFQDRLQYTDSAINLQSTYVPIQYYEEAGWKQQIGKNGNLVLFSPVQISRMQIPGTGTVKQQSKFAVAGALSARLPGSSVLLAINGRDEITDGLNNFVVGSDAAYSARNWLSFQANLQQTYRTPTLNELYYYPGGNPGLKPESGWAEDAGWRIKVALGNFILQQDASVYNRDIDNWILWFGGAVWTPHNIAKVNSRGIETDNTITWKSSNWELGCSMKSAYVLATTTGSYIANDGSIGKQIPYTPRYSLRTNISIGYKRLSLNYSHSYTGYRFTVSDESEYLLPYQTGNLQILYNIFMYGQKITVLSQIKNVWNADYQVIAGRPMPGVNWNCGIKWEIANR
jgi:vitamin B12 transporter